MCYANPTESLDIIARQRMGPEKWAKFEADFQHFCTHSGLLAYEDFLRYDWAMWAYLCGKGL